MKSFKDNLIMTRVLELTNKYAAKKIGSLFVIVNEHQIIDYSLLYPHIKVTANISELKDSEIDFIVKYFDGAIVLDYTGNIFDVGCKLKQSKIFVGHGSRHSSAFGVSYIKGITSILSSEEDGLVRIFKNKSCIAEISPVKTKNKNYFNKISEAIVHPELFAGLSGLAVASAIGSGLVLGALIGAGGYVVINRSAIEIKKLLKRD